ncbi:MAG: hypothetical protein RJB34_1412 [Pseudomonadota bacterium]
MLEDKPSKPRIPDELDEHDPPPTGRFCDLVMKGGVINGVAYPGFLMELARRFHFHSLGGTSVGAVAACLAAAAEYRRRFGQLSGFNEGLRELPQELGEYVAPKGRMTRLHSLFQTDASVLPLFNLILDVIEAISNPTTGSAASGAPPSSDPLHPGQIPISWQGFFSLYRRWRPLLELHFPPSLGLFWWVLCLVFVVGTFSQSLAVWCFGAFVVVVAWLYGKLYVPFQALSKAVTRVGKLQGFGFCSGMRSDNSPNQGITEWLHQGIQDMSGMSYCSPLTFEDLWRAPCGPKDADGKPNERSIDLFTITTCISQGRAYKLPCMDPSARLFFRLSEFKKLFPADVIAHLRRVSLHVDVATDPLLVHYSKRDAYLRKGTHRYTLEETTDLLARLQKNRGTVIEQLRQAEEGHIHPDPDIRELPGAALPIVVAARMSLSVPILFQAVPLLGFDLQGLAEDMTLQRLWFTDGGLISNFPIHVFDQALPRWPTFGVQVEEEGRRRSSSSQQMNSFVPYFPEMDATDRMVLVSKFWSGFNEPGSRPSWAGAVQFLAGLLNVMLGGEDQSHVRLPNVRNRVLHIYTNGAIGNSFNIKVKPKQMMVVNERSIEGGLNLVRAYLSEIDAYKMPPSLWEDHRWVRLQILIDNLREHLKGFETALFSKEVMPSSLYEQIAASSDQATPPLRSRKGESFPLSPAQKRELQVVVDQIRQLETALITHQLPMPMAPFPATSLRTQPDG